MSAGSSAALAPLCKSKWSIYTLKSLSDPIWVLPTTAFSLPSTEDVWSTTLISLKYLLCWMDYHEILCKPFNFGQATTVWTYSI